MSTIEEFVTDLAQRKISLWEENGKLHYLAPAGALGHEEIDKLRADKQKILLCIRQARSLLDGPIPQRTEGSQLPLPLPCQAIRSSLVHPTLVPLVTGVGTRIVGVLNIQLLSDCIDVVVRRHDALRTRIILSDDNPHQEIDLPTKFNLDSIDIAEMPLLEYDKVEDSVFEKAEQVDISVGPAFLARLLKISEGEHILVLKFCAFTIDGFSSRIVSKEIWTLYLQGIQGLPPSLPPLPIQWADYVVWQIDTYEVWLREHGPYWKKRLAGVPKIQLKPDEQLGNREQSSCAPVDVHFGRELSLKLREFARTKEVLLSIVVLALHVAAIFKWRGIEDLIVTVVSNARYRPELANMVGALPLLMPLRIGWSEGDTVHNLLRRIETEFYTASEHLLFGVVTDIVPEFPTDVRFNWQPSNETAVPDEAALRSNLPLELFPFLPKSDVVSGLVLRGFDTGGGISARVLYQSDLFTREDVQEYRDQLVSFATELAGGNR